MNILYHHRTQGKGVEGVHIHQLIKAFQSLGHQVDITSPAESRQSASSSSQKPSIYARVSKAAPEICFEVMEILYNAIAFMKLVKVLRRKPYHFIYERYAIFNIAGVLAAKLMRVPIFLEVNYTSYSPLVRKRSRLLKPLAHLADMAILKTADGIAVVSSYLKSHLVSLGVKEGKIIVTPNAADPDSFNESLNDTGVRSKLNIPNNKVIGFTGGFYP